MHTLPMFASGAIQLDLNVTAVAQFILFTAFVVLMKDLIFDPLIKVFEERERRTAGAIDDARDLDERAIELKNKVDARLDDVRREAAADRARAVAKLKQIEGDLLGSARNAAAESLTTGIGKVEAEAATIRKDLEGQRASLAAEIASRVLGREVRP
ncbi:MAG: H(+)-transporting ATPase [Deltaproteobacteria bacterium]|nr:H(+)-transporting ATPase [Deltaproteobacteria bacterium]